MLGGRGRTDIVRAFAWEERIYLRTQSPWIVGEAVHEGTHALDYNSGLLATLSVLQYEKRAWFYEHTFYRWNGASTHFDRIDYVVNFIRQAYRAY